MMIALEHCSDCSKPLQPSKVRKGKRCRSCQARVNLQHPERVRRHREAMEQIHNDPVRQEQFRESCRQAYRKSVEADPLRLERAKEHARQLGLSATGHKAPGMERGGASRRKAAETRLKTLFGWLPDQYAEDYRNFRVKCGAAEAKRLVLEQIEKDKKKPTGSLQPVLDVERTVRC